jgi:hypothetical protein
MRHLHVVLQVAAWLIGFAWLLKLVEAWRGLARVPNLLDPEYDVVPAGRPSVTVVVPARNEAANVMASMESLLGQDYSRLRILAVDDRSTDETGAILDRLAGVHGRRLEVVHISELPAGWLGKTHAMAFAARYAIASQRPDYILFSDADIVFRADAIRRSLAEAAASSADHFVLLPTTIAKTSGEGMLLAFLQVLGLWAVRPWRVGDPKAKRDAIGVGAFNLIRTEVYEALGGFDATPMEVLEDLTLGRRVKGSGYRQSVAAGPGMVSVHWAAGVRGIVNGMGKNLFAIFGFRPVLLLGAALWVALFCIAPVGFLVHAGTRGAGVMALASAFGLYALSSHSNRLSAGYAAGFPIAAAVLIHAMLRSMVITLWDGGVMWRGTFYPIAELRSHVRRAGSLW